MDNDQAALLPLALLEGFLPCGSHARMHVLQEFGELAIAPARNRKDEFQRLPVWQAPLLQLLDVVQRQQAAVGHHGFVA
jgi:hypothetical protein